jgi:hypothetical protein
MKISGHKTDSAYRRYNIVDNRDIEDAEKAHGVPKQAEMIYGPDDKRFAERCSERARCGR